MVQGAIYGKLKVLLPNRVVSEKSMKLIIIDVCNNVLVSVMHAVQANKLLPEIEVHF